MTKKQGRRSGRKSKVARPPRATAELGAATSENRAALRIVRALKGPNNKYINPVYNALFLAPVQATPGLQLLNGVQAGTGENNRIGRLTKNKWLDLDFSCFLNTNASATLSTAVRVYVVAETTALGSALAPAQFFVDAANFTPFSQRDRTNRNASRYVVLWDSKPFILGTPPLASGVTAPETMGAGQPMEKAFSLHLPLDFQTDYSRGSAGTVADIDTNSLYLMVVCDSAIASSTYLEGSWTLCFSDDS